MTCIAIWHNELYCPDAHPDNEELWCVPCRIRERRIREVCAEIPPSDWPKELDWHKRRLREEGLDE